MDSKDLNDIIDDIGKLWSEIEGIEVEEKTKKISWNDNSTKKNSHLVINGKKLDHTVYRNYYTEVINTLFHLYKLDFESKYENIGRSGINQLLIKKLLEDLKLPQVVLKFINDKISVDPVVFLMIMGLVKEFVTRCSYKNKKPLHLLNRNDLADEELLMEMVNIIDKNKVKISYLVMFYNYVSPFKKVKTPKQISEKVNFHHPVVENHCKHKLKNGTSESSVVNYKTQLKSFFTWCCNTLVEFEDYTINTISIYNFSERHLQEYKLYLQAEVRRENRTANGAKQHFVYVKEFFSYVHILGFLKDDISSNIPNLQANPYRYRDIPTNKQIQTFFETISIYSDEPLKEKLAYSLMLFLGFRANEVANVKWGDINLSKYTISVNGKNKESEILPLPVPLKGLFFDLKSKNRGYVFSDSPKQFKEKLYQNFKLYKIISGWESDGGVHLLRHTYITKLTKLCTPDILQVLARQKSLRSTAFYIHHNEEELTEAVNQIFERGDFNGNS
jgi:integrase/recombinase XerD